MNVSIRLFNSYLTHGLSREYLSEENGISRTTLWRRFTPLLKTRLNPQPISSKSKIVALDGFYLAYPCLKRNRHKDGFKKDTYTLLWAIDCDTHKPVYWQFYDEIENMRIWKSFIHEVSDYGLNPDFLIHDGHPGATLACSTYYPEAKQQRCLAHFMSNMNKDLGISPKTKIAKELKGLVYLLFKVTDTKQRIAWDKLWLEYLEKYSEIIKDMKNKKDAYEGTVRISREYLSAL